MNRAEKRRNQKLAAKGAKNGHSTPLTPSIRLSPGQPPIPLSQALNIAIQHHSAGQLPEAERIYQQILRIDPNQPTAMHLIGVIAHQVGRNDLAVELINKALVLNPNDAEAHNNLGDTYRDLGRFDKAVACHQNALALNPDFVEAYNNLGSAFKELGRLDEAVTNHKKALALKPDHASAHHNLGLALQSQNELVKALHHHQIAVTINPDKEAYWGSFATCIETLVFTTADEKLWYLLSQMLMRPSVRPSRIVRPIVSSLRFQPDFLRALETTTSEQAEPEPAFLEFAPLLSKTSLLLQTMILCPIHDLKMEHMLRHLRHGQISATITGKIDDVSLPFSIAMALHCFTNEYVFSETDEEKRLIGILEQLIAARIAEKQDVPPVFLAALGAYRPLYHYDWAHDLGKHIWTDDIQLLIKRQISEPLIEQALHSQIPQLTPILGEVSQSVRAQYEENPYPRWIQTGTLTKGRLIGDVLKESTSGESIENYVSPENPEILIAGCGTGQHILYTNSAFSNANILAIDLSLSSLSYAKRKTNEYGLTNIEYAQADIMELGDLGRKFDLIESAGVLHHLGEPLGGWQVLVDLLRPAGIMKIALYSETARQHIVTARKLIADEKYDSSPDGIRHCREDIIARIAQGNQELATICDISDFFSLSDCRDLLFHVQEHRFTLPQIEQALKDLNLRFLGFEIQQRDTAQKVIEARSHNGELTTLSQWHEFELENPHTFISMYQFWCQKI